MLGPGTEVGRYVIKRKLAEGGMAEIFLASAVGPEGFSKDVVIKVVKAFLAKDSQFVQMFIDEARLVSKLNHANVVQIFDFGKHGESFYLAMEYVRGASLWDLRKRCRDRGVPFPPTLAAEIGAQVARGLQYAHALKQGGEKVGVVHRDVTPHNVLLSFDGAVKLTDFGIAKATTQQTAPGMLKGKFAYMAPEQARGEKVDARTDLFALGIVLWELLTGGRLFTGDSDLALLRSVQESLIAPPARLNPDVPQELSDVVMKALSRPVEERFQSGFEMEKALANFVLRNAKSVDDSSVAMFLQHLFKEEFEAPSDHVPEDGDDFGEGKTAQREKPKTITATPVPTTPGRRGVMDDDDEPSVRTEEFTPHARPRTEQMPAMKRPSRKLEPLPVQEPSVVVRPSVGLPDITSGVSATEKASSPGETEPALAPAGELQLPPEKSKAPIIGALAVAAIGLVGLLGYIVTRPNEPLPVDPAPVEVVPTAAKTEPAPEPKKEPLVVVPEPITPPVIDAGQEVVAVAPPPKSDPEPEKAQKVEALTPVEKPVAPVEKPVAPVRKYGSIAITAKPFAMVTVPGKPAVEVTGMKSIQAPVGTYEISISHPRKKLKQKVTVTANQTTSVTFSAD